MPKGVPPSTGIPGRGGYRRRATHCVHGHRLADCAAPVPGSRSVHDGAPLRRCRCCGLAKAAAAYETVQVAASLLGWPVTRYLAVFGGGVRRASAVIAAVESGSALPTGRAAPFDGQG